MCGIAAIVSLRNSAFMAADIAAMTTTIRHRGPDDEGYMLVDENQLTLFHGNDSHDKSTTAHIDSANSQPARIAFGHRRLSINDLSRHGHQPMNYLDRYWIIFNGEIYNYVELRDELLAAGYTFKSHGDTEVILAAYDKWGPSCLQKFNGMWAFVIYDRQTAQLFISRDRFGVKPLYYYKNDDVFVFASEIKAILTHPQVTTAPNLAYINSYLQSGAKDYGRETAFKNIYRFSYSSYWLGTVEDMGRQKELNEKTFWKLHYSGHTEAFDKKKAADYIQQYYKLLTDAVKIRLRADVKVGSALSGGLDSSSVVYIINQLLRQEGKTELQETFSIVYKSAGVQNFDESNYIDELATAFHLNSKQVEPTAGEVINAHRKLVYHIETPQDGSTLAGWFTYRLVKQHGVTVTLDGQGADEQQGGYLRYLLPHFSHIKWKEMYSEYKTFSEIPGSSIYIWVGIAANIARTLGLQKPFSTLAKSAGIISNPYATVNQALYADTHHNLLNLLHYADSNSMAFSVESRMPFMDYRLMEFWSNMPACYKLHQGWTKYVARLAMQNKLPDNITWRKDKKGWPMPDNLWFGGSLKGQVMTTIEKSPLLKIAGIKPFDVNGPPGKNTEILLRYYNLAIWYDTFFGARDK